MAAVPMAVCGRRVVGIERDLELLEQSRENQRQVEELIAKNLPLEFRSGTLPERRQDAIEPKLRETLNEADIWYSYPWPSELAARIKLFKRFSKRSAYLVLYIAEDPVTFTVGEIQDMGLRPVELANGKLSEELGLAENSWWSVFSRRRK